MPSGKNITAHKTTQKEKGNNVDSKSYGGLKALFL